LLHVISCILLIRVGLNCCDIRPTRKEEEIVVISWKFESSLGNSMACNIKILRGFCVFFLY